MSRNPKRGRKGKRHPNHYVFTREDCRKGYRAAKAKCEAESADRAAWFWRMIRGFYRKKGTWYPQSRKDDNGEEENGAGGAAGGDDGIPCRAASNDTTA